MIYVDTEHGFEIQPPCEDDEVPRVGSEWDRIYEYERLDAERKPKMAETVKWDVEEE